MQPDSNNKPATDPSTSPEAFEDAAVAEEVLAVEEPPVAHAKLSDIELVVRQAKHQFGDTLPEGYLNEAELKLYIRLYGKPLRATRPEDIGMPIEKALLSEAHKYVFVKNRNVILKENDAGELEEIEYHLEQTAPDPAEVALAAEELGVSTAADAAVDDASMPSDAGVDYVKAVARNQREFDALMKLQKDFERATLRTAEAEEEAALEEEAAAVQEAEASLEGEEEEPAEEQEEWERQEEDIDEQREVPDAEFSRTSRVHEFTEMGHWKTNPSTIELPKASFVEPITQLLGRSDHKHVQEAAEKAFGGVGLPDSVATPQIGKSRGRQNPIAMQAGHHRMNEINADAYIATNLPGMYASTMSVLVETRRRMGPQWLHSLLARGNGEGPRVLDVGTAGAGMAAWEQVLKAEYELLHGPESKGAKFGPPGKKTVVVGSDHLRHRVSRFLDNTTFLPRLPDYLHSGDHPEKLDGSEVPQPRKTYDVIIASHQLLPLKQDYQRRDLLDNLWEMLSPEGGVLIVLEKGMPRGFEAVADVRQRLLDEFIESPTSEPQPLLDIEPEKRRIREPGMIIAPCTNHKKCPMYLTPGLAHGRKDFCHFSQRFHRPPFLQQILNAAHRNHEDVDFSFVAIQRGVTPTSPSPAQRETSGKDSTTAAFAGFEKADSAPNPLALPRNIMQPLKRQGHVTFDLCTPAGTIERWTVPKSFSRQAYHDARKAKWGDLWALGAKTRVQRPVRLGKGGVAPNDGGVRDMRAQALNKKSGPRVVNMDMDTGKTTEGGRSAGVAPERSRRKGKKTRSRNYQVIARTLGIPLEKEPES